MTQACFHILMLFQTQFYDRKYDQLKSSTILTLEPIIDVPTQVRLRNLSPEPLPNQIPNPVPTTITEPIQVVDIVDQGDNEEYDEAESSQASDEEHSDNSEERMVSNQSSYVELEEGEGSQCDDHNDSFDDDMFYDAAGTDDCEIKAPLSECELSWVIF